MIVNGLLATIGIGQSDTESYGFENKFIKQLKNFIKNLESCIINSRKTTKYFEIEKRTR